MCYPCFQKKKQMILIADQKLKFLLLYGEMQLRSVLMGLPWGEGTVKPGYTCRTTRDVFTLFFLVRSQSYSQPGIAALSRNSDLRLIHVLHPPVHTVFYCSGRWRSVSLLSGKMLLCELICQGTQGTVFPVWGIYTPGHPYGHPTPISQPIFSCHGCRH